MEEANMPADLAAHLGYNEPSDYQEDDENYGEEGILPISSAALMQAQV